MENSVYLIVGIFPLFYNLFTAFATNKTTDTNDYYQNPSDSEAQLSKLYM